MQYEELVFGREVLRQPRPVVGSVYVCRRGCASAHRPRARNSALCWREPEFMVAILSALFSLGATGLHTSYAQQKVRSLFNLFSDDAIRVSRTLRDALGFDRENRFRKGRHVEGAKGLRTRVRRAASRSRRATIESVFCR